MVQGRGAEGIPSADLPAVEACGDGAVAAAILSMSSRSPAGDDATYLAWHMLDHLPEQYRIPGVRLGARFVSTPDCAAARLAAEAPYDAVDHLVAYLFAPPVAEGLDAFFTLGPALHAGGRMPMALPRVHVGGYDVVGRAAARRVLAGAEVVPWRPAAGILLLVEPTADQPADPSPALADLAAVPGVAGAWLLRGRAAHPRATAGAGLDVTIAWLDGDPPVVAAAAAAPTLRTRWAATAPPLLAAPMRAVVPGEWDRHLPG